MNINTNDEKFQYILEKIYRDFVKAKNTRKILYDETLKKNADKAQRLLECSKFISTYTGGDEDFMLLNRCKQRFCPECEKINAIKRFSKLSKRLKELEDSGKVAMHYIFTIRNCEGSNLRETISKMNKALSAFLRKCKITDCTKRMEVTYNENKQSFHPHFHCILLVPPDNYLCLWNLPKTEFMERMRRIRSQWHTHTVKQGINSGNIDYLEVYARKLTKEKDLLECVKYSIKPISITEKSIKILSEEMKGLRLYNACGELKLPKDEEVNIDEKIEAAIEEVLYERTKNGYEPRRWFKKSEE